MTWTDFLDQDRSILAIAVGFPKRCSLETMAILLRGLIHAVCPFFKTHVNHLQVRESYPASRLHLREEVNPPDPITSKDDKVSYKESIKNFVNDSCAFSL